MSPSTPVNADNPVQVLKLLKKKERTSATELGTTKKLMEHLRDAGFVKEDGTYKTGKKGKPPVAWVPAFDYDPNDAPAFEQPTQRQRKEISQEHIDRVIEEVQNSSYAPGCSCIVEMGRGTTLEQIRSLNGGCQTNYVCSALDAVRRRGKLTGEEPKFQEVV